MQTKSFLPLCLAIVFLTAFISCNKNKDDEKSKTDLLTSGQWKISAITLSPPLDTDGDGDLDSDLFALYEPCQKDDYLVFNKDGSLELNSGPSKCDPAAPQSYLVFWGFINNEKEIFMGGDHGIIQELTNSRLRINGVPFSGNSTMEITFTK